MAGSVKPTQLTTYKHLGMDTANKVFGYRATFGA